MLAPISSIKHYVNVENADIANGARRVVTVVDAEPAPANTDAQDVAEGSIVKAIFLELWVKSEATSGNNTKFQLVFEKIVAGQNVITFTQMNNLASYPNKKNIFFYSQGVIGDATTQSIPVIRQWFKIPKGKQRMGAGDALSVSISATGAILNSCGFATYKEYS